MSGGKPQCPYKGRMDRHTDKVWLIWSNKWGCWYRANSQGYTAHLEHAGLFDRETAARHFNERTPKRYRDTEPFPLSVVRAKIDARIAELEDQAASTLKAIDWLKTTLAQSAAQS